MNEDDGVQLTDDRRQTGNNLRLPFAINLILDFLFKTMRNKTFQSEKEHLAIKEDIAVVEKEIADAKTDLI